MLVTGLLRHMRTLITPLCPNFLGTACQHFSYLSHAVLLHVPLALPSSSVLGLTDIDFDEFMAD